MVLLACTEHLLITVLVFDCLTADVLVYELENTSFAK